MASGQLFVFIILFCTLILFIWGRWRYDVVAFLALIATVLTGVIPYSAAFVGFSNPAVVTVAEVMIISSTLANSGVIVKLVKYLTRFTKNTFLHISSLCIIAAVLSAFMNNVGALALLMPIAMQTAKSHQRSPALLLMPLAFSSILGGLITLIGTPPNILISAFRMQYLGKPYSMFDFAPVGLAACIAGVIFIVLIGWRLLPRARMTIKTTEDTFNFSDYITEVRITKDSIFTNDTLEKFEKYSEGNIVVLGIIREGRKRLRLKLDEILQENDILIIETSSIDLEKLLQSTKLEIVGSEKISTEMLSSEHVEVAEVVVPPNSSLIGRSVQRLRLRSYYGINLLALAREGLPVNRRLSNVGLKAGDVLLLQGRSDNLTENINELGFLPLAERGLKIGLPRTAYLPLIIFILALIVAARGMLPVTIAFGVAILAMILLNILPVRRIFESIDFSVLVLLGAMIPVGNALQSSGGTQTIANLLLAISDHMPGWFILGLVLIITMTLSDIMNNAATAVVMAPIAATIAQSLHYNVDPFLMAVAVGSSCAFLTPIGHQNNTLVMGPGGYRFGDYWRMGLPLEILIIFVSLPMIEWVWPL